MPRYRLRGIAVMAAERRRLLVDYQRTIAAVAFTDPAAIEALNCLRKASTV